MRAQHAPNPPSPLSGGGRASDGPIRRTRAGAVQCEGSAKRAPVGLRVRLSPPQRNPHARAWARRLRAGRAG
eukprot:6688072-Alexandrium_andersonii.AAC.1